MNRVAWVLLLAILCASLLQEAASARVAVAAVTKKRVSPKKSPVAKRKSPAPKRKSPAPKPKSPSPKPAPKPKSPPKPTPVGPKATLCFKVFKINEQCGGNGGSCKQWPRHVHGCTDGSYWNQACCEAGTSCQRSNNDWFSCKKVKKEKIPALPLRSQIPANKTLPAPKVINYPRFSAKPTHKYLQIKYETDWYTAEAVCRYYYGAHLASIHGLDEMWRVNNQAFPFMSWLGATDVQQRGIFTWTDGSTYDWSWWQQNPGVSMNKNERCVALQDGFQTWPCNKAAGGNNFYPMNILCQLY